MSMFVTIGTIDELQPGDPPIIVEIRNKWVAVFNINGKYYAIEDVCTHDGGPLAEGHVEGCTIACPRHGAAFDLKTGKVLSAPAFTDVPAYEVRVQDSEIQIGERKNR